MARKILVQAGHEAPRDPNHASQTGARGELEFAVAIADALTRRLRADQAFTVQRVPGYIVPGTTCDAAIFEHADGSANPSASGYTFGFDARYPVNARLAGLIADEYRLLPHRAHHGRDNYTAGLRAYYGYSRVQTKGPEVVVESGFVSNPGERAWLMAHVEDLAAAQHRALRRHFGLPATPPAATAPAPPAARYRALDANGAEISRGRFIEPTFPFIRAIVAAANRGRVTIEKL